MTPAAAHESRLTRSERTLEIAGLHTTVVGEPDAPMALVLLHGYAMQASDLTPFAHSLGVPALFLVPQGPVSSPARGHAWWEVDIEARKSSMSSGARDLAGEYPRGLGGARLQLGQFLDAVAAQFKPGRIVIGGFSQGGMLALDFVLRGSSRVDGLILMSASRVALEDWQPHCARLHDLPVFVSHGRADRDLAFAAGEALRDFVLDSGARASWVPFESGHEIPLVVWRGLRKFLGALLK
jgi:phospholipase/carboxylesterase